MPSFAWSPQEGRLAQGHSEWGQLNPRAVYSPQLPRRPRGQAASCGASLPSTSSLQSQDHPGERGGLHYTALSLLRSSGKGPKSYSPGPGLFQKLDPPGPHPHPPEVSRLPWASKQAFNRKRDPGVDPTGVASKWGLEEPEVFPPCRIARARDVQ